MALILVADDDELVVELVRDALRSHGHVVGTLNDGLHVIDVVTVKRPRVVILDCSMPGLSGLNALRQIRSSKYCFDTPVLMLTGRASPADEEIAQRAGADYYMRKPFDVDKLVAVVDLLAARKDHGAGSVFASERSNHAQFTGPSSSNPL